MKTSYIFDADTLLFTGCSKCVDDGTVVENSVDFPPFIQGMTHTARILPDRSAWEIIEDYRHSYVVDAGNRRVQVTETGPLPEGLRHVPWDAVEAERAEEEAQRRAADEASTILTARMQHGLAQTESFTAPEFATFAKAGLFNAWAAGVSYETGQRIVHEGVVYGVIQPVAAQAHQPPGGAGMLAVYRPLSVDAGTGAEPDGSRDNPYAFISGMDVRGGRHYSFEGKLYLAKSDMIPCVWNPGTPGLWQWELVA